MKDIGFTQEGNRLVEMNDDEYREFARLRAAVQGDTADMLVFVQEHRFMEEFDFTNIFHVIRVYYLNRFAINSHRRLLDDMEKSLNEK